MMYSETLKQANESLNNDNDIFDSISNIMNECSVKKDLIDAGSAGKYFAFTIDSILEVIRPLLAKYKLIMSIKHKLLESQYIEIEGKYGKKTKHNAIIETVLILKHKNGTELDFQAIGEGSDSGDKAISKAQTDSYKKIICQMFAISDGDDKDKNANDQNEEIKNVVKKEYQKTNNFEKYKQELLLSENLKDLKTNYNICCKNKNNFTEVEFEELIRIKDNKKKELESGFNKE